MKKVRKRVETSRNADGILIVAAQMIVEDGIKEVNISKLAEKTGVSRASIHAVFKTSTDIYLNIVTEFLKTAQELIEVGLQVVGTEATPIERLTAIFRATCAAFEARREFGLVVLQQLDLTKEPEKLLAFEIFERADQIIGEARVGGELAPDAPPDNWKIRQMMFVVTRGLLRSLYMNEGKPNDAPAFNEKEVEIEVLKVLSGYCSAEPRARLEEKVIRKLRRDLYGDAFDNQPDQVDTLDEQSLSSS